VLTTYSIVSAETRRETQPLHEIAFHRIVLDESHVLKSLTAPGVLRSLKQMHAVHRCVVFVQCSARDKAHAHTGGA
jgi:hypothetical protein